MGRHISHQDVADLIRKLEHILTQLDERDAKLPALKVDEAIARLCASHDIERSSQSEIDFK